MNKNIFSRAFKASVPIMAGYVVLGIGFGVLLRTNGYGILWAFAISLFVYAGSMQYVLVGLLSGGASFLTTALTTFMVNARHLFYGISMIDRYKNTGWKKPYLIFALTDETYSLVCHIPEDMDDKESKNYCFLVSLFNQIYWIIGSLIGVILGQVVPFSMEGIDFALTALFITIFTDQWLKTKNHLAALIGVGATVICLLIFGSGNFLVPSMIVIMSLLLGMKRFLKMEDNEDE